METLASVTATRDDRLAGVLGSLTKPGNAGGLVALFTADAPSKEVHNVARLQWRFASLTVVLFDRSAYDRTVAAQGRRGSAPAVASIVHVDGSHPFAAAWNTAFSGRSVMAGRGFG
jgi:hypothetical protein